MYAKRSSNVHHMQGVMGSLSSSTVQQKHNVNISIPSSLSTPPALDPAATQLDPSATPASCAITIDRSVSAVDKLELESYKRKCRQLELALEAKQEKEGHELTEKEKSDVEKAISYTELAGRLQAKSITITHTSGDTESVEVSELPNSYRQIKNLVWIESQPIYKTALAEWNCRKVCFEARVERKTKRSAAVYNEIYNLLGYYIVFQGVLLTSTAQSNYLHCQNVWLVLALSLLASGSCLLGITVKLDRISALEKTICDEESSLKEARERISSLKRNGEAFRFYDFLEDKEKTSHYTRNKSKLCGLNTRWLVILNILSFSVLFATAHPLILCYPGPNTKMKTTEFINGTDNVITLKEGNTGMQRFLCKLAKQGDTNSSYKMTLDTNATYREYHLSMIPASSAGTIVVSSDVLIDNKVITIMEVTPGVFSWEGVSRIRKQPSEQSILSQIPSRQSSLSSDIASSSPIVSGSKSNLINKLNCVIQ